MTAEALLALLEAQQRGQNLLPAIDRRHGTPRITG